MGLVQDIQNVLTSGIGTEKVNPEVITNAVSARLKALGSKEVRKPSLRMSNIGTPCTRKLWYTLNLPQGGLALTPQTQLKFMYGDIIEALLMELVKASGHKVEGEQDYLEAFGIKGRRDCIVDGMLIDIKSASSKSFNKFKEHRLREEDPFGYIDQLTGYLYASKDDPLVTVKDKAGFLVVDKVTGGICLDVYDLSEDLKEFESRVVKVKQEATQKEPPARAFDDQPEGKSGNRKLGVNCSYCDFKYSCWENLRGFSYSYGPVFLSKVVKEPNVTEFK